MKKIVVLLFCVSLFGGCGAVDRMDSTRVTPSEGVTAEQAQENAKKVLKHTVSPRAVQRLEGIESDAEEKAKLIDSL